MIRYFNTGTQLHAITHSNTFTVKWYQQIFHINYFTQSHTLRHIPLYTITDFNTYSIIHNYTI